jgi:myo-inositol-hexaphosphate 3-phosphohydrolase
MRKLLSVLSLPLLVMLLAACQPVQAPGAGAEAPAEATSVVPKEAVEEATAEAAEAAAGEADTSASPEPELVEGLPAVFAVLETRPILDMEAEDALADARLGDMDDPAIWLHPTDAAQSIVAAAMKDGGMEVYDLDGNLLQSISPEGVRYNNVDVVYNVPLGGATVDLIAATDRYGDKFAFFRVDPETRELVDVTDPANPLLFTPEGQESDETTTAYGIALYHDTAAGEVYVFANRRETGELAQFLLSDNGAGQVAVTRVRDLLVPTPPDAETEDAQTEGMVVDVDSGILYVGQENFGVWKFEAAPDGSSEPTLVDTIQPQGQVLQPDVEGLTIYYGPEGSGYLLVSSQGDNTFAVYERSGDNAYLGSFQVGAGEAADGAQESDGAMVLNVPLGERFPNGILIVQDGNNQPPVMVEDDGELENVSTNLKFIDWAEVANSFDPPLLIDTESYTPRP